VNRQSKPHDPQVTPHPQTPKGNTKKISATQQNKDKSTLPSKATTRLKSRLQTSPFLKKTQEPKQTEIYPRNPHSTNQEQYPYSTQTTPNKKNKG
jgi:hypothetical protein